MEGANNVLWPLASSPDRARWAALAVERYLRIALIIMARAATWPAPEAPFPPQALDLARQLGEVVERQVDVLGRPPRPDVLCAHCGGRPFFAYAVVLEEEAWPAICEACGLVGLIGASGRWVEELHLFELTTERRTP